MPATNKDARLIKAFSHPIRMRALIELSGRVASPSELANDLDESLGVVSYHIRQLLELDCIELVKTEPRRGAIEHYYTATTRPIFDEGWADLPPEARLALSSGVLSDIWRDVGRAVTAGSFDRKTGRHLSRTNLVLDEQSWDTLNARLKEVVEFALELQAEAAARLAEGEDAVVSKLALMHYPAPTEETAPPPKRPARRKRAKAQR